MDNGFARRQVKRKSPCCIQIQRQGVRITLLILNVVVGERDQVDRRLSDGRRIRNAFASYSSLDRDDVLLWVAGARTFGVDVFVDVLNLRAGVHFFRRTPDEECGK